MLSGHVPKTGRVHIRISAVDVGGYGSIPMRVYTTNYLAKAFEVQNTVVSPTRDGTYVKVDTSFSQIGKLNKP